MPTRVTAPPLVGRLLVRALVRLALTLALFMAPAACSRTSAPAGTGGEARPPAPDPAAAALLRAAGDRAALVLLVRPERWPAVAAELGAALQGVGGPPLARLLAAPDLASAAAGLFAAPGSPSAADEGGGPPFPGFDPSRPIVAALFEPDLGDLALAARALVLRPPPGGAPGIRHRVLVPATDPAALVRALTGLAEQLGLKTVAADDALPALRGGALAAAPDGFAAFVPEEGRVRVELLVDDARAYPDAAARLAAWDALVADGARTAELPATPALAFAASRRDFLVIYHRPWQLRDLGTQLGTGLVLRALEDADPSLRPALLAAGFAEVSTGYLLMSPRGAEVDDVALSLDMGGGLRLAAVTSLTEAGAKLYAAADAGRLPPRPAGSPPAVLWSRADLGAALAAAPTPPALAGLERPADLPRAVQECGAVCLWYLPLRHPFGLARALVEQSGIPLGGRLPSGFAAALTDAAGPPRGAVAAVYPPGAELGWLTPALADLSAGPGCARLRTAQETRPEGVVVLAGLDTDPAAAFTTEPVDAPDGALFGLELDFERLEGALGSAPGSLVSVLRRLGRLRALVWRDDRALVSAAALSFRGQPTAALPDVPRGAFAGLAWESPGAAAAATKGALCLEEVTRSMRLALQALAAVSPDQQPLVLARAVAEVQRPLSCAAAQPETRETAGRVQLLMALGAADLLEEGWHPEAARQILDLACTQGHAPACERAAAAARTPSVALAQTATGCGPAEVPAGSETVRVPAGEAPAAAAAAAAEPFPSEAPPPTIAPDESAPFARVQAAADALAARGAREAHVLVRADGWLAGIPVGLRGPAPAPAPAEAEVPAEAGPAADAPPRPGLGAARAAGLLGELRGSGGWAAPPAAPDVSGAVWLQADGALRWTPPDGEPRVLAPLVAEGGAAQPDLESLRAAVTAGGRFDRPRLHLQADAAVAWREVAPVLAALACDAGGGRPSAPVVLAPPPARAAAAPPDALGGLGAAGAAVGPPAERERSAIQRVVRAHASEARSCYERELAANPACAGTVLVRFTIGPAGSVTEASAEAGPEACPALATCLAQRVRGWTFPAPESGSARVSYPFSFAPAER
jgi:hypothetical protein